jgi:hypothetical protein
MHKSVDNGGLHRAHLANEIEILIDNASASAYIVWPWWSESEDIHKTMQIAHSMGYTDIVENGNWGTYTIPEVDCSDWDYAKVVAK